ncbi:hypothetical protein PC128_g1492 [Phytophthora cactorum]|nr:hypothetical protein PC128_g1492 [Phytophthora cactorum]
MTNLVQKRASHLTNDCSTFMDFAFSNQHIVVEAALSFMEEVLSIMTSLVANSLQSPMQKQASQSTDKRVYISCGHNRGRRKRPITLAMAFLLENDDQIFEAALSFVDEFKLDGMEADGPSDFAGVLAVDTGTLAPPKTSTAEGGNQSGKLDEETINSTDE